MIEDGNLVQERYYARVDDPDSAMSLSAALSSALEHVPEAFRASASVEWGDWDDGSVRSFSVSWERPETDEERSSREARHAADKSEIEIRKRRNFLREAKELGIDTSELQARWAADGVPYAEVLSDDLSDEEWFTRRNAMLGQIVREASPKAYEEPS